MQNNDNLGKAFRRELHDYQAPDNPDAWMSFVKGRHGPFWQRNWFSGGIVGIVSVCLIGILIWQRQNKVNSPVDSVTRPASPYPMKPVTRSAKQRPAPHPRSAHAPALTSQVQSSVTTQPTGEPVGLVLPSTPIAQKTRPAQPNGLDHDTLMHMPTAIDHATVTQPLNRVRSGRKSLTKPVFSVNRRFDSPEQRLKLNNVNRLGADRISAFHRKESPAKAYTLTPSKTPVINENGALEAADRTEGAGNQPTFSRFTQPILPLAISLPSSALKTSVGRTLISPLVTQPAQRRLSSGGIRLGLTLQPSLLLSQKNTGAFGGGLSLEIPLTRRLDLTTGLLVIRQQATLSSIVTDSVRRDSSQVPVLTSRSINTNYAWWGLEVPLNLRYRWHQRPKQSWLTTVGVSSLIAVGSIQSASGEPVSYTSQFQPFRLLMVSVGIDRTLTKQYHIVVSPFVKIPLGNVGVNNLRFSTVGFQLTLSGLFFTTSHRNTLR